MFPSASSLSSGISKNLTNTDWLYNQSFQVPVETLLGDDDVGGVCAKESKLSGELGELSAGEIGDSVADGNSDLELVEEIVTVKDRAKKKKKKSKKYRDSSNSRSRSRSATRRKHSHRRKRDDDSPSSRSRDKRKGHKNRESRKRDTDRSESPTIIREENNSNVFGNKVFLEEVGLPPEKAFRQDTRPDRNNLAFDSIYNLHVSSYDKKKCLRTKSLRKILNEGRQSTTERYFDSKLQKMINDTPEDTESFPSVTERETINLPEMIPVTGLAFKVISNETRNIGDSIKDFHDSVTSFYIKAKDPAKDSASKDVEISSLSTDEKRIQNKNKEFNEHLRSHPNDIEGWFKFLQWQEDCFIWSASENCRKSREIVLAEKKLSIVEKALESNPKCMRLILERLEIMRFTSTPFDLDKEWKRLIFIHPNVPLVWKNYFLFLQTHLKYFSITKITRAFYKCFDIYNSMLEGTFQTHQITPNLEMEILKCLYHFTICLRQSGYEEKSIAIWQILIEFNLFTPEILTLEQPVAEWKVLLEPFWDSGCSRFGEPGALGWMNVIKTKSINQGPSRLPIDELEEPLFEQFSNNKSALWLQLELLRERHYWLPVKGPDADQADDTERNVSIEDLTRILFRFRLDQTKYQLIVFFHKFLGSIDSSDILDDHFLIDDKSIFSSVKSLFDLRPVTIYDGFTSFQDQVFVQSIEKFKGQSKQEKELIIWRLKFLIEQVDVTIKYKEVKKIIKDYLKTEIYRNDLDIWLQLAQLEMKKSDESKEAVNIFATAINLFTGRINNSRYLLSFTRYYCELLLGISRDFHSTDLTYIGENLKESETQVIKIITSVTIGQTIETINSPSILKAKKMLDTMTQEEDEYYLDVSFSKLILLLIVDDSDKAFNCCDNLLSNGLVDQSNLLGIFTIYLQLLIFDARRKIKSISRLRQTCRSALELFPDNKPFLSLFTTIETNIALPITVDRFFTQLIRSTNSSCLNIWIFKLHFELKRLTTIKDSIEGSFQSFDGIIRRINSLFERCLSFPCNQGIVLLWRFYLKFNMTHGNHKRAESIVYQAVQHCPWSRIIYLDAIDTFPHLLTDLITIMVEKEIRLRAPLEEIDLLLKSRGLLTCNDEDENEDKDEDEDEDVNGQQEETGQSIGDIDEDSEDSMKDEKNVESV